MHGLLALQSLVLNKGFFRTQRNDLNNKVLFVNNAFQLLSKRLGCGSCVLLADRNDTAHYLAIFLWKREMFQHSFAVLSPILVFKIFFFLLWMCPIHDELKTSVRLSVRSKLQILFSLWLKKTPQNQNTKPIWMATSWQRPEELNIFYKQLCILAKASLN